MDRHELPVAQPSFRRDVIARFGLVPNFFSSAEDAPEMVERLWDFDKAAYIDNFFAEPARSDRARRCLRQALSSKSFEYLMGLLTFVRSAHYWTVD
jgi:hypothetical protein